MSQEQLPHILKTAEMLKIKGLAEMPDPVSLTKSESKSSDQTEQTAQNSGGESMWGSSESQQQYHPQQPHHQHQHVHQQQRRTPSPGTISPSANRRKRLRKASTGTSRGNYTTIPSYVQETFATKKPTTKKKHNINKYLIRFWFCINRTNIGRA